jgi:hypothetical protein
MDTARAPLANGKWQTKHAAAAAPGGPSRGAARSSLARCGEACAVRAAAAGGLERAGRLGRPRPNARHSLPRLDGDAICTAGSL